MAVDGGYRGGALNLAARLCGIAAPAEILASPAVTHLARKVEGVAYVDRGTVQLKGLADPVHVIRLRAEANDAADDMAFRRALGSRAAASLTPAVPGAIVANPYKGLRAFEEGDAVDFFGREELVEELIKRVQQTRFLAVVGPSGSGKSSVVRAGLIPALRRGAIAGSEGWHIADMFPGAHPLDGLESALLRAAPDPPASLMEQLERDEHGLHRAVLRLLPSDQSELVLVIDQFEEVFTLVEDEDVRTHFLGSLEAAANDPRSRLRVVVTLRADFYDRPLLYRGFAELFKSRVEAVVPLSAEELERAISGPGQARRRLAGAGPRRRDAGRRRRGARRAPADGVRPHRALRAARRTHALPRGLPADRRRLGRPRAEGRGALRGARRRRQGGRPAAVPAPRRARERGPRTRGAGCRDAEVASLDVDQAGDDHGPRHVRRLPAALVRPGRADRRADDRAGARGDAHGVASAAPMDRRRARGPPDGAPSRGLGARLDRGRPGPVVPAPGLASGAGRGLARRAPGSRSRPRNASTSTRHGRNEIGDRGGGGARRARAGARAPIVPAAPRPRRRPRRRRARRGRAHGLRDRPAAERPRRRSGTRPRASSPPPRSRTSRSTRSGASCSRWRRST